MIKLYWQKSAVFFLSIFFSLASLAVTFPEVPHPFRYVNDYTHTLSQSEQNQLEKALQQYSQQTSSQIAVVILPTVGDYDIAQYAFALGDKWGIGRKQLDNGVLMLIAKEDRKIFIATGQGLEGALPDAFLSQLIRQQITPYFRQNQYAQGIANGLSAIIAASQGEYAAYQEEQESDFADFIPLIIIFIFIAFLLIRALTGNQVYISPTSNHRPFPSSQRNSNNHFGGGFGGGSGGGFGGGGFGGGGAGGSW